MCSHEYACSSCTASWVRKGGANSEPVRLHHAYQTHLIHRRIFQPFCFARFSDFFALFLPCHGRCDVPRRVDAPQLDEPRVVLDRLSHQFGRLRLTFRLDDDAHLHHGGAQDWGRKSGTGVVCLISRACGGGGGARTFCTYRQRKFQEPAIFSQNANMLQGSPAPTQQSNTRRAQKHQPRSIPATTTTPTTKATTTQMKACVCSCPPSPNGGVQTCVTCVM